MESDRRIRTASLPLSAFACLLVLAVALSGCSTLQKKFTRKKKNGETKESQFVPVLQPEAYPEKAVSPPEMYKYHYSLWQVWQKDFQAALADSDGDKRKSFLLNRVILETEAMTSLLVPEKQKGISDMHAQLLRIRDSLERPAAMRNDPDLMRQIESIRKRLHKNYKFEKVQDGLISVEAASALSL